MGSLIDSLIADLDVQGVVLLRESYRSPFAVSVPEADALARIAASGPHPLIPFHFAEHGTFEIRSPASPTLVVPQGSFAIGFGGKAHQIATGRRTKLRDFTSLIEGFDEQASSPLETADEIRIVCGAFTLQQTPLHPLMGALPDWWISNQENTPPSPLLGHLTTELSAPQPGGRLVIARVLEILCVDALRSITRSERDWSGPSFLRALHDDQIMAALTAFHEAPAERWTVQSLAAHAHLSPSRFATRFRETLGDTAMRYVSKWRLHLAARHICDTEDTLEEIAEAVGYDNAPAFGRAFRREFSVSPGRYRARGFAAGR